MKVYVLVIYLICCYRELNTMLEIDIIQNYIF